MSRYGNARYELSLIAPSIILIRIPIQDFVFLEEAGMPEADLFGGGFFGTEEPKIPFSIYKDRVEFWIDIAGICDEDGAVYQKQVCLRSNLRLLLNLLSSCKKRVAKVLWTQHVTIDCFSSEEGLGQAGLSAVLSKEVVMWASSWGMRRMIDVVVQAMSHVYKLMVPEEYPGIYEGSFRAFCREDGFVVLQVLGDTCDLSREDVFQSLKRALKDGYRLTSHNVDTIHQQLSLLAGLAALSDCVRKNKKPLS